jgi:uncharacterized membrane-anchored protein YitT (DUF2179 family)
MEKLMDLSMLISNQVKKMNNAKLREMVEITAGVILMSAGFYFFLLPTGMIIGGIFGISVILRDTIQVSTFMYIANIFLLFTGLIFLGKVFFFKTVFGTLLTPTIVFLLEKTVDKNFFIQYLNESPLLISAIFGGLTIGIGLAIVLRSNASTGGMDVVQMILSKYLKMPFSTAMYITDGLVLTVALFINFEIGLYAIASTIIMGICLDKWAIDGKSAHTIFVVTYKSEEIQEQIFKRLKRGVTKIKVIGGYSKEQRDMMICTVERHQLYVLKLIIKETDPKAFSFVMQTKEAIGEGFSREVTKWETKN